MEKLKNYLYRIFSVLLVASLFSGSFQSMVYASENEELQTQEIQQIDEEPEEEPENEISEETQEEPEEETPDIFEITYMLYDGVNHPENPYTYEEGTEVILKEPTKEGYLFKGWYLEKSFENEIKNIPKGSTADLELFAKWKVIEYTISYVGIQETDEHLNPIVYDVETETIYLKEPTKTGYVFVGWFTDSKYKNEVSKVPKGSTGNKTFYARWAPDEYTIKFHGNGASKGSMSPLKDCKYDEKCRLPKNEYKRLWYTFVGWNTKKNGSGIAFDDEESVKELIADESRTITLYAQWKKKFDKKGIDVSEYQGTIN